MTRFFQFGLDHPAYPVRVLNEREARAGAGLLLLLAGVAFMKAWFLGDFSLTRVAVVAFFIDFTIRVLVNPTYAPSLVLGRIFVRHQKPDYVGAPQKRFAWSIGLALAAAMMVLVVFNDVRGPLVLLVCLLCITFLFFEAAFGICIGCTIYNLFNREKAQLCPGGACEIHRREDVQRLVPGQLAVLAASVLIVGVVALQLPPATARGVRSADSAAEAERCRVPAFAIAIGHEQKWKLHNNCP
ncbi:DUF4395 domain-containing protein [Phreatobacter sp.]|uniref:DUF4395 domain-containing protein n=1 Tax=Phreatobacter sp. TaxID=1966341 RepID=UPI003F71FFC0